MEVDHIVENQIIGHAVARALGPNQSFMPYIPVLREALNLETFENYNVTLQEINGSKGSVIGHYLRDGIYRGEPLRAVNLSTHFSRYMAPIFNEMNEALPIVREYISGRRVNGNDLFHSIANNLDTIFEQMDLDPNRERRLRNRDRN